MHDTVVEERAVVENAILLTSGWFRRRWSA
jgi:hypothetical protein